MERSDRIPFHQVDWLRVQRRRIRERSAKFDPQNTVLRWGATIRRREYQVPWPNSLWHVDGHHSDPMENGPLKYFQLQKQFITETLAHPVSSILFSSFFFP